MARFRAYSDTSSESSEDEQPVPPPPPPAKPTVKVAPPPTNKKDHEPVEERDEEDESSEESESDSGVDEEDMPSSPSRSLQKSPARKRNALVEDEDGEFRFAHEVNNRVSSKSPPSKGRTGAVGRPVDSSIIPWAQTIGVESSRMHTMQQSLFRQAEESARLKALQEPPKPPTQIGRFSAAEPKITSRKHGRDSDGEGRRLDSRERASFGYDVQPPVFKPSRKYTRVAVASSLTTGNEGSYADAGLALGSSFRVGWGPGGTLVHLGSLCNPFSKLQPSKVSSTVTITQIFPSTSPSVTEVGGTRASLPPLAVKLLQHHLNHTTISRDDHGIPTSYPSTSTYQRPSDSSPERTSIHAPATSSDPLNFASFSNVFPPAELMNPAPIFRLGRALFDPIDLCLGRPRGKNGIAQESSITPDIRNRILLLRRKNALSRWLGGVVKQTVEGDLRVQSNGSTNATYTAADAVFTHLTGCQTGPAVEVALQGGYIKLATLVAQAGGDELFKDDLTAQLEIWKSEKLSPGSNAAFGNSPKGLVERGVWRVYRLLAGIIHQEDDREEDSICVGLDWKRVFGLLLWYGTSADASVADVVRAYEAIILRSSTGGGPASSLVARPVPKWAIATSSSAPLFQNGTVALSGTSQTGRLGLFLAPNTSSKTPDDPLYALIKLQADPALSLSNALNPLSFDPSAVGWGIAMCWHLYIVLCRVMKVRDFADRVDPAVHTQGQGNGKARHGKRATLSSRAALEDEPEVLESRGYSLTADLLTNLYASKLESWGLIQEAVFVLMHLETPYGREKAIKDLLARNASKIEDWTERGLVGSLKVCSTWISEARALYALDSGDMFAAYEHYISARDYDAAHALAVSELASDIVIRGDVQLLKDVFLPFDTEGKRDKIDGWFVRGKIFIEYADIAMKLRKLKEGETLSTEETDELARRIPKIITLLPEALHRSWKTDPRHPAAVERMTKELLEFLSRSKPLLLDQNEQPASTVLDSSSRINLVAKLGFAQFLQSIEA